MKEIIDRLTGCSVIGPVVTILSSPDSGDSEALSELADAVVYSLQNGVEKPEEAEAAAAQWVCKICGYVYEGDELPADFKCPICGAGTDQFELK